MTPKWNILSSASIGKLLLATGLFGLAAATASASTVFQVRGTFSDGSAFSGTLTIDTVAGNVTAANVTIPSVAVTCNTIFTQAAAGGGPGVYELVLQCTGEQFTLFLPSDPVGDLLGYTGGSIATSSFQNGNGLTVAAGTVISEVGLFQVRYASNLVTGADAVIDVTNTGASATAITLGVGQNNIDGNLCVNVYTFSADEQEVACCSCLVTPNALFSASVKTALLNSTLTPSFPNEVVIKLISTFPLYNSQGAQYCNPGQILTNGVIGEVPGDLQVGMLAWGTSAHGFPTAIGPNFAITETPFSSGTLSQQELVRDVEECQFIQILGSGQFGLCKGCTQGGLGASAE